MVCCRRSVSLCRMQFPEARLGPSVRRGLGAERPSWLKGHGWGWAQKAFALPTCFPTKENPWGVGFGRRDPQQSSRAQGAGAAQPQFALWRAEARG